jgi:hypothetical protein
MRPVKAQEVVWMASSSLPVPEPPPLGTRAMFRLFVLAMIAGVGMGLFGFFFTWVFGAFVAAWVRAGKKWPA